MIGNVSWTLGLSVLDLMQNLRRRHLFSTLIKGLFGIDEVLLSILCILEKNGLTDLINLQLDPLEEAHLKNRAEMLWEIQELKL